MFLEMTGAEAAMLQSVLMNMTLHGMDTECRALLMEIRSRLAAANQKGDCGSILVQSAKGFESLLGVLLDAYNQAAAPDGKGMERHGRGFERFEDQPWHFLQTSFPGFCQGQAVKKLQESMGLTAPGAKRRELLGAIVYTAMSIIHQDERDNNVNILQSAKTA